MSAYRNEARVSLRYELELGYEPGGFGPPTLIDKGLADLVAEQNRRR